MSRSHRSRTWRRDCRHCPPTATVSSSSMHIGERNIMVAEEMLSELNIPIVGRSTGGKNGRKIIFNTHTGEVLQCYIKNSMGGK